MDNSNEKDNIDIKKSTNAKIKSKKKDNKDTLKDYDNSNKWPKKKEETNNNFNNKHQRDKDNIYDISLSKYFNIKNAKKIEINTIESNEEDLVKNIKNIFKIKFLDKSFYRMKRKCDLDKVENIYFYCNNHRTAKNSKEVTEKGNPK